MKLQDLEKKLFLQIEQVSSVKDLESIRVTILGKKGIITEKMRSLCELGLEQRKSAGKELNVIKERLQTCFIKKLRLLEDIALDKKLLEEKLDVTLTHRVLNKGSLHPIPNTIDEVIAIFGDMNFEVCEGPDIEDDWYNFNALNIPPEHPARQMQDTFYLPENRSGENIVLRTHTSPVQIRTMQARKKDLEEGNPIRIIAPGRTFRCDSDLTHTPMFHQIEGLVIEKDINFSHLKGVISNFISAYFEISDIPIRFRPSFFPFTEPSAEVDIGCLRKDGVLKIGLSDDWLEILGCGIVNPKVLENCGIDSSRYQGFAFGMGVERIAMLKYGISDLRKFFDGDIRWLKHYGFSSFDVPSLIRGL